MIVCSCFGVSDKQIKAAHSQGMSRLPELREALGVSADCGKCAMKTMEIIRDLEKQQTPFYEAA